MLASYMGNQGEKLTGIPQLVDMPAPVNTTTFFASARTFATTCSSPGVSAPTVVIDIIPVSRRAHSRGTDHLNMSITSCRKTEGLCNGWMAESGLQDGGLLSEKNGEK